MTKRAVGRPAKRVQVGWRVPITMREKLRREAKRRGITLNAEANRRLDQSLKAKR